MLKRLIPLSALFISVALHAGTTSLQDCHERLTAKLSSWRFYPINEAVLEAVKRNGSNPSIAEGDFDDDRINDLAFLIQKRSDNPAIAVCLSSTQQIHIIDEPYCYDSIARIRKGQGYFDYEHEREGRFDRDGVLAYCFEKAGATYIFEDGGFRRIVNSD